MTIPLWRQIQKQNFTSVSALVDFLHLSEDQKVQVNFEPKYPLNVPLRIAQKMKKGDLKCPITKQFLPLREENEDHGFPLEPVEDSRFRKEAKLIKKYEGRALLLLSNHCVMNCRFCFRQHFPYEKEEKGFLKELAKIAADSSIAEVILSGGDPLSIGNGGLTQLFDELGEIPHVKRVRFHTRFPLGIPERIDNEFLTILKNRPYQFWFVIHSNHLSEWDPDIAAAHKRILGLGIPVLCQSVLLKGINDSTEALTQLFEYLSNLGIQPYYLHQLDRVKGAHHFEESIVRGKELMRHVAANLSGYALPRYVQENPGEPGKTILF